MTTKDMRYTAILSNYFVYRNDSKTPEPRPCRLTLAPAEHAFGSWLQGYISKVGGGGTCDMYVFYKDGDMEFDMQTDMETDMDTDMDRAEGQLGHVPFTCDHYVLWAEIISHFRCIC